MEIIRLEDIEGMTFPTGRRTRVLVGPGGLAADGFVQGYVVLQPGGSIPAHGHRNEETYTFLTGTGEMTVGSETRIVKAVSTVYIPPDIPHALVNTGSEEMIMMFVYSPAGLVDHWAEELAASERE